MGTTKVTHVHGRPDNQEEWLDDTLGRGKGDPDLPSGGKWIGVDLPKTETVVDDTHWSTLPPAVAPQRDFPSWYDSDNDARSPLEADLEDIEGGVDG